MMILSPSSHIACMMLSSASVAPAVIAICSVLMSWMGLKWELKKEASASRVAVSPPFPGGSSKAYGFVNI